MLPWWLFTLRKTKPRLMKEGASKSVLSIGVNSWRANGDPNGLAFGSSVYQGERLGW